MSLIKDIFKGGVEGIFGGVSKLIGTVKADPTQVIQLEAEIIKVKADIEGKIIAAESGVIAAVNQTMQAEAKSEHWMQWAWRPCFGFTGAAILVNNYILLPYFKNVGLEPMSIPSEVWIMLMAVLGVAAYTRGTEKIARLKGK